VPAQAGRSERAQAWDPRPLQTRFPFGSGIPALTCPTLQLAGSFFNRHAVTRSIGLPLLVGTRFHVLFHSPPGVLFTFPSRYWFAIGHAGVFSLTRWFSQIHTGFPLPRATRDPAGAFELSATGLSPAQEVPAKAISNELQTSTPLPLISLHHWVPSEFSRLAELLNGSNTGIQDFLLPNTGKPHRNRDPFTAAEHMGNLALSKLGMLQAIANRPLF